VQTQKTMFVLQVSKENQSVQEIKNYKKKCESQTIHVSFWKFKKSKFKREIKIKSGQTLPIHVHASSFWFLTLSAH